MQVKSVVMTPPKLSQQAAALESHGTKKNGAVRKNGWLIS